MSAHTPLPWSRIKSSWEYDFISGANGEHVAEVRISSDVDEGTQDEYERVKDANAALIVRAVNAHDDLVSELQRMLSAQYDGDPRRQESCPLCIAARAAIAKATGAA